MYQELKSNFAQLSRQFQEAGPNRTCSMSTINPTTIQDVSQDPRTHPIEILDQNNNNNNNNIIIINSNQYISNRLQPSFINNNFPSQTSTQLHHDYIGDSLNQQILLPETCHIITQTSEAAFCKKIFS